MSIIYTESNNNIYNNIILKEYQEEAISTLRQRLLAGKRRPVVVAPTGAGKTVMAASIIKLSLARHRRVLFTVPALSLIDQSVERFRQNGIDAIGVIQGMHEMTDYRQPVQVCSVQTLARREIPEADLVIVDECHIMFKLYEKWMKDPKWASVPFVGLTATPLAKGMGKIWDDVIVVTTTDSLIKSGDLSDFKVYAPAHPDLSGVKTVAGDYDLKGLGEAMDKGSLVADIVTTWLERGQERPTICFCVNRVHAKNIQTQFVNAGVAAEYMDAYTDLSERAEILERFKDGTTKIICNVGVLTTGFDADVRCIILARPTKSQILFIQMIGRGLRTAEGKDHCLILDHSDTHLRLGFVTDIPCDKLDDGNHKRSVVERTKPLPKECPKCSFLKPPKSRVCPSCGFVAEAVDKTETEDGELYELTRKGTLNKSEMTMDAKQAFYSELLLFAYVRGFKSGWASHAYRDRFKVWPHHSMHKHLAKTISPATQSWITSRNIRKAKSKHSNFNQTGSSA
jgi:DNA repair protein RadD